MIYALLKLLDILLKTFQIKVIHYIVRFDLCEELVAYNNNKMSE